MVRLHIIQKIRCSPRRHIQVVALASAIAMISVAGILAQLGSRAATSSVSVESESGQISSPAKSVSDNTASGSRAVQFGAASAPPPPPPALNMARKMIAPGIADPGVLKVSDSLFFMSGTAPGNYLPIYKSTDLQNFSEIKRYDPNTLDSAHTYCFLWAPSFIFMNNKYYMYFTAQQVGKGQACPDSNIEPAVFYTTAPDTKMNFGAPQPVNNPAGQPRTYPPKGCPSDGCQNALRIDQNVYFDGSQYWMHYVWYAPGAGNTVSAFPLSNPSAVFEVARPSQSDEQGVNEGPTLFSRAGTTYLMYSQGGYNGKYALRYLMAPNVKSLVKSSGVHIFSQPLYRSDGSILETLGHNSVTDKNGQYYDIYHVGNFSNGVFTGRDTYIQPIVFKADGTLQSINTINLQWKTTGSDVYSLDVRLKDGSWIAPCVSANILNTSTSYTYTSVCHSANERIVQKSDITAMRMYHLSNGNVTHSMDEISYDGYTDTLHF